MEKNRVLWILLSVSLFLVVVLAGGLYLLRPSAEKKAGLAAASEEAPPQGFDSFEYVRGRSELPKLKPEKSEPEQTVIVVGEKPKPEEKPAPEPTVHKVQPAAPAPQARETRPAAQRPVPTTRQPEAAAPVARPSRRAAPAVKAPQARSQPAPRPTRVREYWIQAGSYTSHARAQEVAQALDEQGLAPKITTRELSGKTYYRVRIGPYGSKPEAEKFLDWVRQLSGFETSYISLVYAQRKL